MNYPTHIVLHTLAFEGEADIDTVRQWHLENGWSDVGYHYLVRRSGQVQEGRREEMIGAHALGYNRKSIGIACEGHGDVQMWTLPQLLSLLRLCDDVSRRYAISPDKVIGHCETGSRKTCPGTLIDMDAFRALLFEHMRDDGYSTE